jgi:hypothetical protein
MVYDVQAVTLAPPSVAFNVLLEVCVCCQRQRAQAATDRRAPYPSTLALAPLRFVGLAQCVHSWSGVQSGGVRHALGEANGEAESMGNDDTCKM